MIFLILIIFFSGHIREIFFTNGNALSDVRDSERVVYQGNLFVIAGNAEYQLCFEFGRLITTA